MKRILAVAAFVCIMFGITAALQPHPGPTTNPEPATTQSSSSNTEVAVLHAQLETVRTYDERLLATVHWALGIVIAVVLVMAGFGWYANFRLYDRDKEALRMEVEGIVADRSKKESEVLMRKLDRYAEEARATQETFRKEINTQLGQLKRSVEQSISSAKQEAAQQVRDVRFEFADFLSDYNAAGKSYEAYVYHRSLLRLALSTGWESKASKALDRVINYLQAQQEFWYDDIAELRELATKLPQGLAPFRGALLQQLDRLRPKRGV